MSERVVSCATCAYCQPLTEYGAGLCRRRAPTVALTVRTSEYDGRPHKPVFPYVSRIHDWCGDYAPAPAPQDGEPPELTQTDPEG